MTSLEQAHGDTSARLERMHGLATVPQDIALDWPALNNPDPLANDILTLISTMHDELNRLRDMHTAGWRAMTATDSQSKD